MAATQIGTAIVFGMPDVTSLKTGTTQVAAAAATAKAWLVTGLNYSKTSQLVETSDADGDVVNATFYGFNEEATLDVYPASTTIANAKTANTVPAIGSVLQIVLSGATEEADVAASTGYWTVTGAQKTRSNTSTAMFSLTLKRWGGISDVSQL